MSEVAEIGHNVIAKDQIRSIIERVEHVEEEIKELGKDKTEIYLEAKGNGYDVKALRKIVAIRREDAQKREQAQAILDTYLVALGMA